MKKITTMIACAALTAMAAYGVPAKPGIRTITQPDGTTVEAELRGDEYCSFYVGADGKPMQIDADGYMRYITTDATGAMVLTANADEAADTQAVYRALAARGAAERLRMDAVDPGVAAAKVAANVRRAEGEDDTLPQKGMGLMERQDFPTTGTVKSIVILVSYADVDFTVDNPNDYFTRHLNEEGFSDYSAVGSCRDFFVENSMGLFTPQFDLYGPVKLSNNRSYYGGDGTSRHDTYAYKMVIEACAALDDTVDFSQYDLDNDGVIDNIYLIYAGQGQASYGGSDTVWPHSSTISNGPSHDGVRIGRYACSNEWEYQRPDGIGTFVHEFSHVLGLPDLYETTYSTGSVTPGQYSTMDTGPYNGDGCRPPYYSAYERNALGWIDLKLIDGPATVDLPHIGASNEAYIIQTIKDTEFYLFEDRQQSGWDADIPGHGLLVWHIDFDQTVFTQNLVNNDPDHQYVDIVESNGETGAAAGWPFPGTAFVKQREISPDKNTLTPWIGPEISYYITKIYEKRVTDEASHVTFLVDGGLADLAAPVATDATDLSAAGFTANWNAVEGASAYALTVYAEMEGTEDTQTLTFGTSSDKSVVLPDGWSFTGGTGDIYTTASFCGNAAPSLKFSANGVTLTSPLYEAEVNGISFFLRAGAVKDTGMLLIQGRNDESDNWKQVAAINDLTVVNTKGDTFSFDIADSHVRQIQIVFYASSGKVGLDDLTLTFGTSYRCIYGDYNDMTVADGTSQTVEVSEGGPVKFIYSVAALDSSSIAGAESNEITVDLSSYSGITNVVADAQWSITAAGRTVTYKGTAGAVVNAVNVAGIVAATATADSDGVAVLELPSSGFYILTAPQGSVKVAAE